MIDGLMGFLNVDNTAELIWVMVGLGGQLMFSARFLVQWIVSEKERRAVVPVAFWYFSLVGGVILFAYAVYRQDPVFILGQSFGIIVYVRNLYLLYLERRRNAAS